MAKKSKKQNKNPGNAWKKFVIGFLTVVLIFVCLSLWKAGNKQDQILVSNEEHRYQPSSSPEPTVRTTDESYVSDEQRQHSDYFSIKEWNIKIKMPNADPSLIMYQLSGKTNDNLGEIESVARLYLQDFVTTNDTCQSLGIAITRRLVTKTTQENIHDKRVGDYFYGAGGSPYACDETKEDAAKGINKIRMEFTGNNPYNWEFFSIN